MSEKGEVAGRLRQEEAGGKIQPEEECCSRMQRGEGSREAAVLNIVCILLRLHKRVLLDNPSQSFKRKRGKNFQNTTYIYINSY